MKYRPRYKDSPDSKPYRGLLLEYVDGASPEDFVKGRTDAYILLRAIDNFWTKLNKLQLLRNLRRSIKGENLLVSKDGSKSYISDYGRAALDMGCGTPSEGRNRELLDDDDGECLLESLKPFLVSQAVERIVDSWKVITDAG